MDHKGVKAQLQKTTTPVQQMEETESKEQAMCKRSWRVPTVSSNQNHKLQKSKTQYINSILEEGLNSGSNKSFYWYIKSQATENFGVSPLTDIMAKILADQFSSVFTRDDEDSAETHLFGPSYPPIPDLVITEKGVDDLLLGVNPKKASGPDQVPCHLLHELHAEPTPCFHRAIQKLLQLI